MEEEKEKVIYLKEGDSEYVLTEKRIRELTSRFIEECGNQAQLSNDFGKNCKVVELLVNIKKAFWPATQKQITGTVDEFDKQLDKWYELEKKMIEERKGKPEVLEIVPNKPIITR